MPFKYRKGPIQDKLPRVEEVINITTVGGSEVKRDSGKYEYLKFVTNTKVSKSIPNSETGKLEKRDVNDAITTFADTQGDFIDWSSEVPQVIKDIDAATNKGKSVVQVKAIFYIGKNGDKRAKLSDLADWKIVK